ncbi:hypothetical protein, partial [Pseudomonas syringae group genomosp. 7]|uniref:hypothetical protein n=1 Tax=Pseudomonas syringae group genomosp. 7 TaxID=251699 RepID=UPI0037702A80
MALDATVVAYNGPEAGSSMNGALGGNSGPEKLFEAPMPMPTQISAVWTAIICGLPLTLARKKMSPGRSC